MHAADEWPKMSRMEVNSRSRIRASIGVFIAIAVTVIATILGRRSRVSLVASSSQRLQPSMNPVLHLQPMVQRTLAGVGAKTCAIARVVTAEHTLAWQAATKAASPRQNLAEVRAMYLPPVQAEAGMNKTPRPT